MLVVKAKSIKLIPEFCVWLDEKNCKNFCSTEDVEKVDISSIENPIIMDLCPENISDIIFYMIDNEEVSFSLGKTIYKVTKKEQGLFFKRIKI